jgi:hypothetical protein
VSGSGATKIGAFHWMFVKVFSTVYGKGGSGEPTTREVVQEIRWSMPKGCSSAARRSRSGQDPSTKHQKSTKLQAGN